MNPYRDKRRLRATAAEARKREDERDAAVRTREDARIAESQEREEARLNAAQKRDDERFDKLQVREEQRGRIERNFLRRQVAVMHAQVRVAHRLNWISGVAAFIALVSVGAVAVTVWITYGQLQVNHQQLDQSIDALHLDQRAWVATTDWHCENPASIGPPATGPAICGPITIASVIGVDFKNTGKTFALNVAGWVNHTVDFFKGIPDADSHSQAENSGLLVPGASFNINLAQDLLSPGEVYALQDGGAIYFYGTIWYDDVFAKPQQPQHWTQFCDRLMLVGKDKRPVFSPCPDGKHSKTDVAEGAKGQDRKDP